VFHLEEAFIDTVKKKFKKKHGKRVSVLGTHQKERTVFFSGI